MKIKLSPIAANGVCCVFGFAVAFSAFAAERQWTGGGGDNLWQTAANWSDSTVPTGTDAAVFDIGDGNALQVLDSAGVTYPETIKVSSGAVCLGSIGRYCKFSTATGIVEVAQEACLVVSNRIEKSSQAIVKRGAGKTVFTREVCNDGNNGCPFFDVQGGTVEFSGENGRLHMDSSIEGYIRIRNGAVFYIPGYNRTSGNVNFIIDDGGVLMAGHSVGNRIKTIEMNGGTVGGNTVDASAATYRTVANARSGIYFTSSSGAPVAQSGGTLYLAKSPMRYNLLGGILSPTISLEANAGATTENPCVFLLDGGLFAPSLNGGNINNIFDASHLDKIVLKVGSNGARFGSINQENGANPYVGLNIPLVADTENADGGVIIEGRAIYRISKPFELAGDVQVRDGGVALANAADTATTPRFLGAGSFSLRNAALAYQQCATDKELQLATAAGKCLSYEGGSMIRFRRAAASDYAGNADNFSKQTLVSGPLSRTGKGSVLYLWDGVNQYVGADDASKYTVSGGVANGASGAVSQPVVGIKNYDQTFLKYDSVDGFMEFDKYATISDATTADSIVDVSSAATVSADKSIGGLRMIKTSQGVTVAAGKTLTVGNGTDPAIVLMRRNTLGGAGTVNFGASEGVISIGPQDDATHRATVSVKLAGSGGVSYVSAPDTDMYYRRVYVSGANTYTGGTRVNSVRVQVANESAFGVGDVYVGGGRFAGGRVAFDTAITVANDFHIAGTGIRNTVWDGFHNQGALEFNADVTLTGDVELVEPARITMPTANVTATISGTVSGDALEVLRVATSTLVLSGHNTYTGGTEVVSATLALAHGDGAGTGTVCLGNATLRFVNEADIVFTNKVDGVGTIELAGKGSVTFTDDCFAGLPRRKVLRRSSFPFPNVADGDFKKPQGFAIIYK